MPINHGDAEPNRDKAYLDVDREVWRYSKRAASWYFTDQSDNLPSLHVGSWAEVLADYAGCFPLHEAEFDVDDSMFYLVESDDSLQVNPVAVDLPAHLVHRSEVASMFGYLAQYLRTRADVARELREHGAFLEAAEVIQSAVERVKQG